MDIIKCALQHFVGDFARLLILAQIAVQYDTPVPQIRRKTITPGTLSPTLSHSFSFFQCLTSHTSTVRRGLRFVVLIREDPKV